MPATPAVSGSELTGSVSLGREAVSANYFWLLQEDREESVDADEPAKESQDVCASQQTNWGDSDENLCNCRAGLRDCQLGTFIFRNRGAYSLLQSITMSHSSSGEEGSNTVRHESGWLSWIDLAAITREAYLGEEEEY